MKRIVLIKEGEYRPNLFAEFTETVNHLDVEQVGFYVRHDYTFRLTRNRSNLDPTFPLALAHYNVDVAGTVQDPVLFRPIDTESIFSALDKYEYVMFGAITPSHVVTDQSLLPSAMYIARNTNGKLVNALTDEVLQPDTDKVTFITTFFGIVRMNGLPVYTIVLNQAMTHVTDGFDYYHEPSDTKYIIVSDHDGTIKDTVFAPSVSPAQQFGDTLLVHKDITTITLFSHPSVLRDELIDIEDTQFTVTTDLTYSILKNQIIILTDKTQRIGFFTIEFHCGAFFEVASMMEQPKFSYLIIRQ